MTNATPASGAAAGTGTNPATSPTGAPAEAAPLTSTTYDVIVVGAGFAGLTAARELSHAGKRVLVLEGRDRIAGRTWLDERLGLPLELGGTWVHWTQPYVWAELRRYGIGIAPSPEPQRAYWWDGIQTRTGDPGELLALIGSGNARLTARSREVFPQPFDVATAPGLTPEALAELDRVTVLDEIAKLNLGDVERRLLTSFHALNFNGKLDDAAFTQLLRWVALTNGDWQLCFEACASYKIAGGTRALAEALHGAASSAGAAFVFGANVSSISTRTDSTGDVVTVSSTNGDAYRAREVVVTAPLHALGRIRFEPPLPDAVVAATERGQVGLGAKVWFTVEGELPHFVAFGDADWPLNFLQSEYTHGGCTYVIGFGPDGTALAPDDVAAVRAAVAKLAPDLKVLESAGHNWVEDEFAGETWPMHRTGYLTESLATMQAPHGRVHLAGADLANGWGGFIDGAIESGLTVARRILGGAR